MLTQFGVKINNTAKNKIDHSKGHKWSSYKQDLHLPSQEASLCSNIFEACKTCLLWECGEVWRKSTIVFFILVYSSFLHIKCVRLLFLCSISVCLWPNMAILELHGAYLVHDCPDNSETSEFNVLMTPFLAKDCYVFLDGWFSVNAYMIFVAATFNSNLTVKSSLVDAWKPHLTMFKSLCYANLLYLPNHEICTLWLKGFCMSVGFYVKSG